MTERTLTEEAVLTGLQDIRLPADAPGGLWAEMLVTLGMGLLFALFLGLALRLFTRAGSAVERPRSIDERIAGFAHLPEDQRQLALLHLLKSVNPNAFGAVSGKLYHPGSLPDCDSLEAELTRHV